MRSALALVIVLGVGTANAERDVLREELAKRERIELAAAAQRAEGARRYEAAAQAKLAQARAKLAEADVHDRAGRTGSALRAILSALDISHLVADPTGGGHFHPWDSSVPEATTKAGKDAEAMHRVATTRFKEVYPTISWLGIDLTGLTYPSDIVIEQDGVVIPKSDWGGNLPLDPGPHVWTARMDNFEFYRFAEHARVGRAVIVKPQFPFDDPPLPVAPPPRRPEPPRSQIAK